MKTSRSESRPFGGCIRFAGRKVLIDEDRFFDWVRQQNGGGHDRRCDPVAANAHNAPHGATQRRAELSHPQPLWGNAPAAFL